MGYAIGTPKFDIKTDVAALLLCHKLTHEKALRNWRWKKGKDQLYRER
jgi:D-arabinose 1-dehydrogenase-like Zn-dependent alcohol dehydrogenase